MAEDTRTQTPLITDEDVAVFRDALKDGVIRYGASDAAADRYALGKLRARWVTEALEAVTLELQDRCDQEGRKHSRERTEVWIDAAVITRDRAAEYRDGRR